MRQPAAGYQQPTLPPPPAAPGGGAAVNVLTVYNVTDATYGAVGNGTTDATSAINAAITAANSAGGGIVYLPPGTFRVATTLVLKSNVQFVGAGRGLTTILLDDVAGEGIALNASASVTVSPTLTADMARGAVIATLSSVTGISAGDHLLLRNVAQSPLGGWVGRVQSVNSGASQVTFDESSPVDFATADSAQAFNYGWASNARVAHLIIKTAGATPTTRNVLLLFNRALNCVAEHVHFSGAVATSAKAIYGNVGRDIRILHCSHEAISADDTALGFMCDSVTKALVLGAETRNSSAGVTLLRCPQSRIALCELNGGFTASGGRGIRIGDGSNDSVVHGNTIRDYATDHTGLRLTDSQYCVISSNTISNTGSGIDLNTNSSPNRALTKHNVIIGNNISNVTGIGIVHEPNGALTTDMYNHIVGNHVANATVCGIRIGTCGNVVSDNSIIDYGSGNRGIDINTSSNLRNLVKGNYVRNPTTPGTGLAIRSVGGNTIIDNDVGTEAVNLAATDMHRATPRLVDLTYATSVVIDPSFATKFRITVPDATAHQLGAPTSSRSAIGHRITVEEFNNTAGAIATMTFSSAYKLGSAWTAPAAGKKRVVTFEYDGANWQELSRSGDL